MVMTLDSVSNPLVKEVVTLHQKRKRDKTKVLLVEGKHPIEEALKAQLGVYQYFVLEEKNLPEKLPDNTLQIVASEQVMRKLSSTDSPPPCIATVDQPESPSLSALKGQNELLLVLDRLQDPGNLGTLIRSAKAFGVSAVILTQDSVDPFSPKVIRSSAGLVFSLPVILSGTPLKETLKELEKEAFKLVLTQGDGDTSPLKGKATEYKDFSYQGALALVLGNEGQGINTTGLSELKNVHWLSIPMEEGVDSLNVSVCGSILLAEAASQREGNE